MALHPPTSVPSSSTLTRSSDSITCAESCEADEEACTALAPRELGGLRLRRRSTCPAAMLDWDGLTGASLQGAATEGLLRSGNTVIQRSYSAENPCRSITSTMNIQAPFPSVTTCGQLLNYTIVNHGNNVPPTRSNPNICYLGAEYGDSITTRKGDFPGILGGTSCPPPPTVHRCIEHAPPARSACLPAPPAAPPACPPPPCMTPAAPPRAPPMPPSACPPRGAPL